MSETVEEAQTQEAAPLEEGLPLPRRLAAEFVGTLLLVAVGTGAATVLLLAPQRRLLEIPRALRQSPQDAQLLTTLLGSTPGDLLTVALAFGIALAVLVYAFGTTSGAHFNPAVTIAFAVSGRFSWSEVPLYAAVQVVGGIAGAFLIAGLYGETGAEAAGGRILFGAPTVEGIALWNAILAEALIAFVLVIAYMAVIGDRTGARSWAGLVIGLALAAGMIVTAPATGGSANFARSLGPLVASLPYGVGNIPWGDLIVYLVGPLAGAASAALIYESITGPPPPPPAEADERADEES